MYSCVIRFIFLCTTDQNCASYVLISIFEPGSKVSKIVTTETKTFGGVLLGKSLVVFGCYPIKLSRPKHVIIVLVVTKGNTILICVGIEQHFSTVLQFFGGGILACFRVLVCKLKFCDMMWSLPKH